MRALALLVAAAAFPHAAALVVYYNVFSKSVVTAVEIVFEQLTELRASPIWNEVEEIRCKREVERHRSVGLWRLEA